MAIQFNCPYCTSPIRVPDSASGKRGTCPRCKSKILVPKLKPPAKAGKKSDKADETGDSAEEKPPAKKSAKRPSERFADEPDFSNFGAQESVPATPTEPPAEFATQTPSVDDAPVGDDAPATPTPLPIETPASPRSQPLTPYARALRRKRRRTVLWIPVLLGSLLVGGVAAFFLLTGRKPLEGKLAAEVLAEARLEPKSITVAEMTAAGVSEEDAAAVLKHLQQKEHQISRLASTRDLMVHVVEASDAGVSVHVETPPGKRFFRVDPYRTPALKEFLEQNADRLDEPRIREVDAGLKSFFEQAARSIESGDRIGQELIDGFRQRVLINRLIRGAGYNILAVIGKDAYRCVYQDGSGRLYYLLPESTGRFALRGRTLSSGVKLFPGRYTVEVDAVRPADPSPDEDKADPETDEKTQQKSDEKEKTGESGSGDG